jgi:hypothetical protein
MDKEAEGARYSLMTEKKSVPLSVVASFCAHTTEMLESVEERDELLKRHRDHIARLRDSLTELLDGES